MDQFLGKLRQEGALQSSGGFTVDALELPARACLLVLSAAVVGGAAWFHAEAGASRTQLEFPGVVAPSAVFEGLLQQPDSPGLLVAGLRQASRSREVEFTSWDGSRCARARLRAGTLVGFQLSSEPPWTEPRSRVRWTREESEGCWIDRDLLRDLCAFAPLQLRLNQIDLKPSGLAACAQVHIYGDGGGIRLSTPKHCRVVKTQDSGKLLGALSKQKGELRWVHQGVLLKDRQEGPEAILSTSLLIRSKSELKGYLDLL